MHEEQLDHVEGPAWGPAHAGLRPAKRKDAGMDAGARFGSTGGAGRAESQAALCPREGTESFAPLGPGSSGGFFVAVCQSAKASPHV